MKKLLFITLIFSTTFLIGQTRVSKDQVTTAKGGLQYYNSEPFTGIVVVNHKNGKIWKEVTCQDGKVQGLTKVYYQSGKLSFEQEIQNGQYVYIKKWHENGKLMSEQHYKKGKVNLYKEWDETGNLIKEE